MLIFLFFSSMATRRGLTRSALDFSDSDVDDPGGGGGDSGSGSGSGVLDCGDGRGGAAADGIIAPRTRWCDPSGLIVALAAGACLVDLVCSWTGCLGAIFAAVSPDQLARDADGGFHTVLLSTGSAGIFHLLFVYGWLATLIPKEELKGPGRRARMFSQGGHSLMLTYFLGFGALAEVVRELCCKPVAGVAEGRSRVRRAVLFHATRLALPMLALHAVSWWLSGQRLRTSAVALCASGFTLVVGLGVGSCVSAKTTGAAARAGGKKDE